MKNSSLHTKFKQNKYLNVQKKSYKYLFSQFKTIMEQNSSEMKAKV